MRMKNLFFLGAHISFLLTIPILVGIALVHDKLLFKSDFISLLTFVAGILFLTLPVTLVVTIVFALLFKYKTFKDKQSSAIKWFEHLSFAMIFASFVIIGIDRYITTINQYWDNVLSIIPIFFLLLLLGSVFSVILRRSPISMTKRLRYLIYGMLFLTVLVFPVLKVMAYFDYQKALETDIANQHEKRGLILFVVDALGAQYLTPFNSDSPVSTENIESFAKESMVYTRSYTNYPYTHGVFDVMYSGTFSYEEDLTEPSQNLIALLQDAGINVKLIVSHRIPLPDTREMAYKGLRSHFITQNYTFLPQMMGLDYHILMSRTDGYKSGARLVNLLKKLNRPFARKNAFDTLEEELENLTDDKRRSLIIVHCFYSQFPQKKKTRVPAKIDERDREIRQEIDDDIRLNDNTYTEDQKWWVEERREKYYQALEGFDERFGQFIKKFKAKDWNNKWDILLTADHGKTFDNGRIWYGNHIDQNVTRIPLILHRGGMSGINERLVQTADIPATIADIFGVKGEIFDQGYSLLKNETPDNIMSFGLITDSKTALTAVYKGNEKHVFEVRYKGSDKVYYLGEIRHLSSHLINDYGVLEEAFAPKQEDIEQFKEQISSFIANHWPK